MEVQIRVIIDTETATVSFEPMEERLDANHFRVLDTAGNSVDAEAGKHALDIFYNWKG